AVPTPSIDWPAVRAAAFRLTLPRMPLGGRVGERLGSGTGSSLEFQDYRSYAPGDDLRHVDWAAYARSELLAVRLYREEVAPRVDLVIDCSRSMAVGREAAGARRGDGAAGLRVRLDRGGLANDHDRVAPARAAAPRRGRRACARLRRREVGARRRPPAAAAAIAPCGGQRFPVPARSRGAAT